MDRNVSHLVDAGRSLQGGKRAGPPQRGLRSLGQQSPLKGAWTILFPTSWARGGALFPPRGRGAERGPDFFRPPGRRESAPTGALGRCYPGRLAAARKPAGRNRPDIMRAPDGPPSPWPVYAHGSKQAPRRRSQAPPLSLAEAPGLRPKPAPAPSSPRPTGSGIADAGVGLRLALWRWAATEPASRPAHPTNGPSLPLPLWCCP